jgi:hypothetical protein
LELPPTPTTHWNTPLGESLATNTSAWPTGVNVCVPKVVALVKLPARNTFLELSTVLAIVHPESVPWVATAQPPLPGEQVLVLALQTSPGAQHAVPHSL